MLRALLYLRIMSLRNWLWWRARRLRQPKYLIGAVVGATYLFFFFLRPMGARHAMHHQGRAAFDPASASVVAEWLPIAFAVGATLLLVVVAFLWVVPSGRAALGFTEAEIAFLFPAPVSRRALVHFQLVSAQIRNLFGALFMTLISNRWSFLGGNAVIHAVGWWFIFAALNLHRTGASFTLTRLADRGLDVVAQRVLVPAVLVLVCGLTIWRLPAAGVEPWVFTDWIVRLGSTAPLCWLLYPLRLVIAPALASGPVEFLQALGPGLLILGAHYVWVVRTVVSFEEASIDRAEKRAAHAAAWRSGESVLGRQTARARPAPFSLRGPGRPEIAFLWKNLLATWPYFNVRVFTACAVGIVLASAWVAHQPAWKGVAGTAAWVAAFAIGYGLIVGPHFARQDIRSDMRRIDVLKTYPLAGWQIVLGELLTPAAILTGILWLAGLMLMLNLDARGPMHWLTPSLRVACGGALGILVPPLVVLQLLVPHAAVLVFPAWFEASRGRGGGVEVMGQRLIFFFAQLVATVVMLLPAAVAASILILLVQLFAGLVVAISLGVAAVAAVFVAEIALLLWWLGRRFEAIDVAAELRS